MVWKIFNSKYSCKSEFLLADPKGNFNNKKIAELNPNLALDGDNPLLIDEPKEVPAIWAIALQNIANLLTKLH